MQSYIYLSLFAATAFALANLATKFSSKHAIADQPVLLFYYYLTLVPFLLIIPIFFEVNVPPSSAWPAVWLYGLIFFIGNIFSVLAIYRFDSSTFAAFTQLRPAFVGLLAFWFLGEQFPLADYWLLGLMLIGAVLTALDERMQIKNLLRSAVLLLIGLQLIHALAQLFAGLALQSMNSFTILFWGNLVSCIFALLLIPWLGQRLRIRFVQVRPMLISGFFTVASLALLFTAFQSNLTLSSAISKLTMPVIVLTLTFLASLLKPELLEHHPPRVYLVRAFGISLIMAGALKIIF